jgi:hypothetical protein
MDGLKAMYLLTFLVELYLGFSGHMEFFNFQNAHGKQIVGKSWTK